jgi:CubicO group peptidase (beta-lactamase class C family)
MPLIPREQLATLSTRLSESADLRTADLDVAALAERVSEHVIAPAELSDVVSNRGLEDFTGLAIRPFLPLKYRLDLGPFSKAIVDGVKDQSAGFALQLRENGVPKISMWWSAARGPREGDQLWNPDIRMHVASVSKLVTAMAMTRLLADHGISPDAPIAPYLPGYWARGRHVDEITFAQLMTHRSGFDTGGSASDFETMKNQVSMGVPAVGGYVYQNVNFGLCRILLATINGDISTALRLPFGDAINDNIWDVTTIEAYRRYVTDVVFTPAGVTGPSLSHPDEDALAYDFPVFQGGWNSGDLATMSGGVGWHLSVDDLLAVMGTFRRAGSVVSPAAAAAMLKNSFGVDVVQSTPAGWVYAKGGYWSQASTGRAEQTMACFLPGGMELALLVNSPVGAPAVSLQNLVLQAFLDHLVPIFELVTPERHVTFGRTRVDERVHPFPVLVQP